MCESTRIYQILHFLLKEEAIKAEIASPAIWGHFFLFVLWFNSKIMHLVVLTFGFFHLWLLPSMFPSALQSHTICLPYEDSPSSNHKLSLQHQTCIFPKNVRILKIVLIWLSRYFLNVQSSLKWEFVSINLSEKEALTFAILDSGIFKCILFSLCNSYFFWGYFKYGQFSFPYSAFITQTSC